MVKDLFVHMKIYQHQRLIYDESITHNHESEMTIGREAKFWLIYIQRSKNRDTTETIGQ